MGAYALALIFKRYQLPFLVALAAAPVVGAIVGLITGLVALRAVRLYFSLLTLAISQLLFSIVFQWYDFTGGDNGISITLPDQLNDYTTLYYFTAAVVVVCLLLMFVIVRSPFGAALLSIRENRDRAASIGINVRAYELAVYTVASLFAGVRPCRESCANAILALWSDLPNSRACRSLCAPRLSRAAIDRQIVWPTLKQEPPGCGNS